jgi:GGDEF domain-containing protein
MAYARPERALDEAALDDATGDTEALSGRAPASRGRRIASVELREIESLRSINAQLRHELAAIKSREAETKKIADRDDLTGLYNRRRMLEMLEAAICDAVQQDLHVGLLFIDLNGFKAVNDKYGHAAGDICCRYGGDEFVVVLPGVPDPFPVSRVADAIRERISLPYWIGNDQQRVTASIGESMYPHHGENAQKLLHRADEAMYRLKARIVRPIANAPDASQLRLTRRRNDKSKPRSGGTP